MGYIARGVRHLCHSAIHRKDYQHNWNGTADGEEKRSYSLNDAPRDDLDSEKRREKKLRGIANVRVERYTRRISRQHAGVGSKHVC